MLGQPQEHFRRNLTWVTIIHLVLLLILLLWSLSRPKPPKPFQTINWLPVGNLVHGEPIGKSVGPVVGKQFQPAAPAAPASKPAAKTPPAPEPTVAPDPPPPPEPKAEAVPAPKVAAPTAWSQDKPKPPKQLKSNPSTPAEKTAKPKININLDEVERPSTNANKSTTHAANTSNRKTKASPSDIDGTDPDGTGKVREGLKGMTREGIAETLGKALRNSGVDKAVGIGPSGSTTGSGAGENAWYYSLIRDQMYQAWNMPISLSGKKLHTLVRIFIEKNGTISNVELVRSSGNKEHDDSALTAVRRVGRIREPLPEGIDGSIDINFRLTE